MNKRLEIFSDGVFAIAITLLILDIKVSLVDTVHSVAEVWRATGRLWPSFLTKPEFYDHLHFMDWSS